MDDVDNWGGVPHGNVLGDWETYGPPLATVVCVVGVLLGLNAIRLNYAHKHLGQAVAWGFWLCICGLDLFLNNYKINEIALFTTYVWEAEWAVGGLMRLIWLWILLNWTFSRKGHSWLFYPAAPAGS